MSGLDIFAVKSLPLAGGAGASDASSLEATRQELDRLRRLRHPCIASVIGFDVNPGRLHIHMHYAGGGSMEDYLADFGPLGSRLLDRAVAEVLQGLAFLHGCQPPVIHGNLKGSNILVTTKLGAKLSDFGCSSLPVRRPSLVDARCLPWAAPEVVTGDGHDGLKADIWSLSCCVLEMATATRPWGDDVPLEKLALVLRGLDTLGGAATPPLPAGLQGHALLVAQQGLRRSPRARPDARDLLAAVIGGSTPVQVREVRDEPWGDA